MLIILRNLPVKRENRKNVKIAIYAAHFTFMVGLALYWLFTKGFAYALFGASLAWLFMVALLSREEASRLPTAVACLFVFIFTALVQGMWDGSKLTETGAETMVGLKNRPPMKSAKVIRAGERGLLIYDVDTKNLRFDFWGDVTFVERLYDPQPRAPLQ
jgi:hypothetical protein